MTSLQVGDIRGVGMTDTPPSDGPSQGAEFDMMGALDWKDGIATLPGSDIKVGKKFLFLCCINVKMKWEQSGSPSCLSNFL